MALGTQLALWSLLGLYAGVLRAESNENDVLKITYANSATIREGEWMIEFYAPWCSACQQFAQTWESFGKWSKDKAVKVAQVDVTKEPLLSGQFLVQRLPSVFHVMNGEVRAYEGDRTLNQLTSFVEREKWRSWEPIPWWKSPTSRHMNVLGYLYWIAGLGQNIQAYLEAELNMPAYGVMIAIAAITVVVGLLLGGIIVCCFEFCMRWMGKPTPQAPEEIMRVRTEQKTITDEPKTTPGGGATAKAGPRGGATADKAGPRGGATADKDGPRGEEQPAAMSDEEVHGEEEEVKRKEGVKTKKQKKENKAAASPKAASPKAASPKGSKKKSEPGVQEDQPTEDKTALREDGSDEGEEGWSTVRKRK